MRERDTPAISTTTWTSICTWPAAPGRSNLPEHPLRESRQRHVPARRRCWRRSRPRRNRSCQWRGHSRYRGQRPITTSTATSTCSSPTGSTCDRSEFGGANTLVPQQRQRVSAGSSSTSSERARTATQSARAFMRRRTALTQIAHSERRLPSLVAGPETQPLRSCGRHGQSTCGSNGRAAPCRHLRAWPPISLYRITRRQRT